MPALRAQAEKLLLGTADGVDVRMPFTLVLGALDTPLPALPAGADDRYQYMIRSDDFIGNAETLVNTPVKLPLPALSHVEEEDDGSARVPAAQGTITNAFVMDDVEGMPEGHRYACVSGVLWAQDYPLGAAIARNDEGGEWGGSYEWFSDNGKWTAGADNVVHIGSSDNPGSYRGVVLCPRDVAANRQFTRLLATAGMAAIYSGRDDDDLPDNVKGLSEKLRRVWVGAFNGAFQSWTKEKDNQYDAGKSEDKNRESYAFRVAWSVVNRQREKVNAMEGDDCQEEMETVTEEDREAQKVRSGKFGIVIREDGNVTLPSRWRDDGATDDDFADPTNYAYPVWLTVSKEAITEGQLKQVRNAPARFAQHAGRYDSASRGKVKARIEEALRKFGVGEFRQSAVVALGDEMLARLTAVGLGEAIEDDIREWVSGIDNSNKEGGAVVEKEQEYLDRIKALEAQVATLQQESGERDASVLSAFSDVVRVETVAGRDEPPTVEALIAAIKDVRVVLAATVDDEHREGSFSKLAGAVVQKLADAEGKLKLEAARSEARTKFDEIKDRFPEDQHDTVRQTLEEIYSGKKSAADALGLLAIANAPTEEAPALDPDGGELRLDAISPSGGETQLVVEAGEDPRECADYMLSRIRRKD